MFAAILQQKKHLDLAMGCSWLFIAAHTEIYGSSPVLFIAPAAVVDGADAC